MSQCEIECCDKGIAIDGKCHCDIGAFGNECYENLQDIFIAPYYTYLGVYCTAFVIILFITIRQFQVSLKASKIPSYYTCLQYAFALIGSPQNYILILAIIFSICKLIWLILDPFEVYVRKNQYNHIIREDNCNLEIFIRSGLYITILYLWMFIDCLVLKLRLFIVFLVQITVSTINGLRKGLQYPGFLMFCYIFLLVNFFIFIFEFLIYGQSLQECIKKQIQNCKQQFLELQKQNNDQIEQISENDSLNKSPESMPTYRQVSIEDQKNVIKDEIKQIEEVKPKIAVTKIKSVSFARTFISGMHDQSFFRQESQKELKSIKNQNNNSDSCSNQVNKQFQEEQQVQEINSCCLKEDQQNGIGWENNDDRLTYQETIQQQIKSVKETKKMVEKIKQQEKLTQQSILKNENQKLSQISHNTQDQKNQQIHYQSDEFQERFNKKYANLDIDKQILFKIQLLVYFGIIFEILFGVLSIIVLVTDLIRNPVGQLIYLYGSTTLQFFSLITVIKLFLDIKNQELKNLIWISKVGNQKNKINQNYIFSIPQDQKEDEQKQQLEQRINMITLY